MSAEDTTLELIKNGTIVGRPALEWLRDQNQFVFHGTTQPTTSFEPRQAINDDKPDGPPAIFATNNIDIAIFRSLVHREYDTAANRSHISSFGNVVNANNQTLWQFNTLIGEKTRIHQESRIGFVAVLPKENFQSNRTGEVISLKPVEAIAIVKTTIADLPEIIEDLTLK